MLSVSQVTRRLFSCADFQTNLFVLAVFHVAVPLDFEYWMRSCSEQLSSQHVFPSWMNTLQMDSLLYGTFTKSFRLLLLLTSSRLFTPSSIQYVTTKLMTLTLLLQTHKTWLTQPSPTIPLYLPSTTSLRLQLLAILRVLREQVGDGPMMRWPCSLNLSETIVFLQPQEASTWRKMHLTRLATRWRWRMLVNVIINGAMYVHLLSSRILITYLQW